MAKFDYTPAQRTAVFWKGGNLLLSAAAGSGKTAALTGRIAQLIKNGEATLDQMLVVTFTRAAAEEMRQRISSALSSAVDECRDSSPETAAMISRAIAKVPSADISTIHSFLYRTLKPYFPVLGLPQDSRIADQKTISVMKKEIMTETVDEFFASEGETLESFTTLADIIGQVRDTSSIDEELMWLANTLISGGLDHTALLRFSEMMDSVAERRDIMSSEYGDVLKVSLEEYFNNYCCIFSQLEEDFLTSPKVNEFYGGALRACLGWAQQGLELVRSGGSYSDLRAHFTSPDYGSLHRLSSNDATEASVLFKRFRDDLKDTVLTVSNKFFSHSEEDILDSAVKLSQVLKLAANVLQVYFGKFAKRKQLASVIDYNDLESLAIKFLISEEGTPTSMAREIGARYKYIFIDEYQDTNFVQDSIFRAISGTACRFMVGDIKQSVYRFRGAEPDVFKFYRSAWSTVKPFANDEEAVYPQFSAEEGSSLFMSENFRCDKPVVDFVNLVSRYILPHGGINFRREDELRFSKGKDGVSSDVEICLIEKKRAACRAESDSTDYEAEYVARRIASMIGKYSDSGDRLIKAGDIAVLLRAPSRGGAAFRDALSKYGIPSVLKTDKPLSASPAVMLLVCILNFIDNPLRDIYVTGALRSPVFDFSMTDLIGICRENTPLYLSVMDRSVEGDPLGEKCAEAVRWLNRQKTVARGMRADKFLEYLIDEINLFSISGIRESGSQRDSVNRLCTVASDFVAQSGGDDDISAFLDYLSSVLDSNDSGKEDEGGEDCVSIVSIHSSKGLEYPICFVSSCQKKRNISDETRTILFDSRLGLGMYLPDESRLLKCDTFFRQIVADNIRRRSEEEEMRMLYVALTRAKEKLIITAKTENADKDLMDAKIFNQFGTAYHVVGTQKYITWILEAVGGLHRDGIQTHVITSAELAQEEFLPGTLPDTLAGTASADCKEMYISRFDFAYPGEYLKNIPAKLTVSKLSPQILDDGEPVSVADLISSPEDTPTAAEEIRTVRPAFMQETATHATAAEKGTATHIFMQFADFGRLKEQGVRAEIDRLIEERYITRATAELISIKQMERFAGSLLLDKLLRSPMIRREFRFNVRLDAHKFTSDPTLGAALRENGVKLTVQGVVDCVFRDPDTGTLVLIDYKTDSLTDEEWKDKALAEKKLRERHKNQLTYYREICSDMFSEEIGETYIYSTVLGTLVKL